MSWQRRNKSWYFYHSYRVGDRVENLYLGRGKVARSFEAIHKHVNSLKRYARDVDRQARDGAAAGSIGTGLGSTGPAAPTTPAAPTDRPIGASPPPDPPL